ncbi:HNH endonuclease [Mycobacterium sp. NPDC003323]
MTEADDPLLLGQRVVAILETGARVATYKLATLMALIDHCIENLPEQSSDSLVVPIPDLAHRVLELYWRQVRPFEGQDLRQSSGEKERIPRAVRALRAVSPTLGLAAASPLYQSTIDEIGLCLAQQPLYRLQRLPGGEAGEPFLYDDSFLHSGVSRRALRAHGDAIVLMPGVATGLARLAGLLKPALEIMWVEDVRRLNKFVFDDAPDIAGHLFGRDRVALAAVRGPFKEAFGARCFYCGAGLPSDNPIDHVLPWSLVGIDGLANLVLACLRCNSDKRHALPAVDIVASVLDRDRTALEQIASEIRWPTEYRRVEAAANGLYRTQPPGVAMWSGYRSSVRWDVAFPPAWRGGSAT